MVTENKIETIPIDEKLSKDDLEFQKLLQYASLAKLVRRDLNENKQASNVFSQKYDKAKVQEWIMNPQRYEKQLRELSRFLFISSSHYRRAILYFATLPMFKYTIDLYGVTDFDKLDANIVKKKYLDAVNYVEEMNIEHELTKVSLICWIEDTFFGYEYRLKDSYFIQPLDPNYCQISSIEDGALNFQFDFSYFDKNKEQLERVAPEFIQKYNLYKTDSKNYRWQELESDKTICIKINDHCDQYSVPPLSGVIESLYDIEDFKQLKKAKIELENYMILTFNIPYQKDAIKENAFALSLDKSLEFYELAVNELPSGVGALLNPFSKIESIRVDKNEKSTNSVEEAEDAFYNNAGLSKMLFNSSANGASLTKSVEIDEMVVFRFIKQCERWLNRKLKNHCKKIFFKTHFLEMTYMNKDSYIKNVKDAAMTGVPCKLRYASAIGLSPSSTLHGEHLESILGLPQNWKPLQSSYTQSGKNGSPEKDEDDLTPEGEATRARDDNDPDNRG